MRANRYLHIAVICATLLFLVLWKTAAAKPPEKPGNPGLPGCLAKVSQLNDIVANQQETIDQQAARIEELEAMLLNFAPVPMTGQRLYDAGVQWPDPRFTDNSDGTVTDNLTGLIWLKNADCFGLQHGISQAFNHAEELRDGQCGLSDGSSTGDWRLPTIRELYSLVAFEGDMGRYLPGGHPFQGVQASVYWSTTRSSIGSDVETFTVEFRDGTIRTALAFCDVCPREAEDHCHMWPVRGGN